MKNLQNYTDLAIIQPGVAVLALLTTRVSVRVTRYAPNPGRDRESRI